MTESQRFLEIDKLRVSKLDKLRNVECELETQRSERLLAVETLAKERDLNSNLVNQNRALLGRLESLSSQFEAEKASWTTRIEMSAQSESNRVSELEDDVRRSALTLDSLRRELNNLGESCSILEVENKSLKASIGTKQADFNLQVDKLNRELAQTALTKDKIISEQRALIDQLSNSMSEAATQLIESQNISKSHSTELETRDKRIRQLEEKAVWLEDNVRDKTDRLIGEEGVSKELRKQIDQLLREKEIVLAQLESTSNDLNEKVSYIQSLESKQRKSNLIQTNLVSELETLPIINKRLESDCGFLRDDLRNISEKLKAAIKENQGLSDKLKVIDSIVSPEQRSRINERVPTVVSAGTSSMANDAKKLQIETMELRMRLVDAQAARDKAQAQLIEQSQQMAKLQKDLHNENIILN